MSSTVSYVPELKPKLQTAAIVETMTLLYQLSISEVDLPYADWHCETGIAVRRRVQALPIPNSMISPLSDLVLSFRAHYRTALINIKRITHSISTRNILLSVRISHLGTVDFKRTAEALVALTSPPVSDVLKYRLARLFCLEDRIADIWNSLGAADRILLMEAPDIGLGSPGERLYEHHPSYVGDWIGSSDFTCAVVDRNEAAVRYIWDVEGVPPLLDELEVLLRRRWISSFSTNCLPGLYLFLLAKNPTDGALRQVLLQSNPFLRSLFEWPYLNIFKELLDFLVGPDKEKQLYNLVSLIYYKDDTPDRYLRGPFLEAFEKLWKTLVAAAITAPDAAAAPAPAPAPAPANNADEQPSWPILACDLIERAFFRARNTDETFVRLATILLNGVDEQQKALLCEMVAGEIRDIFIYNLMDRLIWLVDHCSSDGVQERLMRGVFRSHYVKTVCRDFFVGGWVDDVERFWDWCNYTEEEIAEV